MRVGRNQEGLAMLVVEEEEGSGNMMGNRDKEGGNGIEREARPFTYTIAIYYRSTFVSMMNIGTVSGTNRCHHE